MPPHDSHDGWHSREDEELGLTKAECTARLQQHGYNELPSARPRTLSSIMLEVVREPMFLLLLACGIVYLALGDPREAGMLLFFVLVVMTITLVQRHKSERSLEALKKLSSPRALVIRRAPRFRIPGREVVPGDLVVLSEGDRIPADGVLLYALNLCVDESLLTGESVSVRKIATDDPACPMQAPGGDDLPCVYSGSLVVQGNGFLHVVTTGADTAIGRIGTTLFHIEEQITPIQQEVNRTVKKVAAFGFALSALVALGYGLLHAQWLQGLLIGITLAMAILPEELPVVMTLFLSLAAWRLAKTKVLTRHVPIIETLGTTTVLCVDKTGTLTQNQMQIQQLFANGGTITLPLAHQSLPENYHTLLEFGLLASHRNPFDPMEMAIHNAVAATLADTEHVHANWRLVDEYPLSKELLAMSRVWHAAERAEYAVAAKGAPEAIIDLCHLDADKTAAILREVAQMATQGLRVLGVARASFEKISLPPIQHDFDFEFIGLLGLADPIRPDVPAAVAECRRAGIRVVMITGDYPTTAISIADQIGLDTRTGFVAGTELRALDDSQLAQRIRDVNIFCRVSPEQKLRLVTALKHNGEIVAMTGDGVNDAPAIRAAHVGIAMGGRGTDVAREAADLVLMDDAFASIVSAVRMGRRTYDNLSKAITFVIAVHVPIIGLSLLPLAVGWPLLLMPVHILFLQLLIDPACSLAFEAAPEESNLMQRPPRARDIGLFQWPTLVRGLLQGTLLTAVLASIYWVMLSRGNATGIHVADMARTTTYATMVLANLGLILCNLSPDRRRLNVLPIVQWIGATTVAALLLILSIPPLRALFYFAPLDGFAIVTIIGGAGISTLGFEASKWLQRRKLSQP